MESDISRILGKIGVSEEALYYWGLYKSVEAGQFAVVKISGECIKNSLEKIAEDLSDLYKLGLFPTVTFGWGKTLTERLGKLGINSEFIDEERCTGAKIMEEVVKIAKDTNNNLLEAIGAKGGKAKAIDYACKAIIAKDKIGYGSNNGEVVAINPKPIFEAISNGFIPIVFPIGISEDGRKLYNINAATAGAEIVKAIDPVKYIMITSTSGVLNGKNGIISEIVLRKDYEKLVGNGILSGGMLKNAEEAKHSLEIRDDGDDKSVQIVGADNLLAELFSRKGAGTYIRNGYIIESKPLKALNQSIVKSMVEKGFGEKLNDMYFEDKSKIVYMEKNMKGFGVVMPNPAGIGAYLDTVVVDNGYARNGLGTDIITAILDSQAAKPKLFWRSKATRGVNSFYTKIAEGRQLFKAHGEDYYGYWIGLNFKKAEIAVNYMQQKPSNFK